MRKPKILVVDDDPDLLKALRLRLRANNCDVVTVTDGYSVVGAAQKEHPDVIVLDLGLPAGDGFVVLAPATQRRTIGNPCDCVDGSRSAGQRSARAQSGSHRVLPEACRQRGTDERNPCQPSAAGPIASPNGVVSVGYGLTGTDWLRRLRQL
jgi:CheY-like chemotaxis protein